MFAPSNIATMSDFWVFGYGSLMWKPGFESIEQRPARMFGVHRALCVYSWVHRGTRDKPGLVLGLDTGGSCRGVAFKVAGQARDKTIDYLRRREQVTGVYKEAWRRIVLENGRPQTALVYVADRRNEQYAGALDIHEQARLIAAGRGQSGANVDYVLSTVESLRAERIHDHHLEALAGIIDGKASS